MKVLWGTRVAPDRDAIDVLQTLHGASMNIEHRLAPDEPLLLPGEPNDPLPARWSELGERLRPVPLV